MSFLTKLSIDDLDLSGHKVVVRVDYNVPIDKGIIQDDRRIRETLPTIRKILNSGGIPILMSHLGRPEGKFDFSFTLSPIAKRLEELIGRPVTFVPDCIGDVARKVRENAKPGDIILLENLRFHPEEEENDENFARELAGNADIYIDDAFGTSHRAHASMVGITKFVKYSAMGYLLKKEIDMLGGVIANPKQPFVAVIGGRKVSSKIAVIENLLDKCDRILIGGSMAWTFFASIGIKMGTSVIEYDRLDIARRTLEKAEAHAGLGGKIFLPIDTVVTDQINENGIRRVVDYEHVPEDMFAVDIGPDTTARFKKELENAETIIMNGPVGVFEVDQFSIGTHEVLKSIAERVDKGAIGVIGGGESAAAVQKFGLADRMSHLSTGGGASLALLEGKPLPAVEALSEK